MLSKFSFPKKGKELSLKFQMVNLCNGGTKDFAELWEITHLKIWTRFSIRQTKLFWINLKHYSQTCSNDHLCKTTTCPRRPMLNLLRQIPMQLLLCKTTNCLRQPATTFLSPKWKKACLKQPLKTLFSKEMRNKHKEQCMKNKHLSDKHTLLLLYNAKFV